MKTWCLLAIPKKYFKFKTFFVTCFGIWWNSGNRFRFSHGNGNEDCKKSKHEDGQSHFEGFGKPKNQIIY